MSRPFTLTPLPPIDTLPLYPGERWRCCRSWVTSPPRIGRLRLVRAGRDERRGGASAGRRHRPPLLGARWLCQPGVRRRFRRRDIAQGWSEAIDRQNAVWVAGARRISPGLLIDLLQMTGPLTGAYFASLDMTALGMPVDWAGPEPAPVWLDVAREYTERSVHPAAHPGRRWEARREGAALVRAGAGRVRAGAAMRAAGCASAGRRCAAAHHQRRRRWRVDHAPPQWRLDAGDGAGDERCPRSSSKRTVPGDCSPRVFPRRARRAARIEGDEALAERALETVSILA